MNVLIVDDDDSIRFLLMRLFKRRGDAVDSAIDGEAAIECLEAKTFDLVLLDLMMPRTDGLGVLAYLRERAAPSPRIIVMTAAVPALAASVPREQIAALVAKPFEIADLMATAENALAGVVRSSSTA